MTKKRTTYYTTEQVATMLGVKPKTVRTWITTGHLAAVKLHRSWRVTAESIDRLFEDCRHAG